MQVSSSTDISFLIDQLKNQMSNSEQQAEDHQKKVDEEIIKQQNS